jgi:hypothetical protein
MLQHKLVGDEIGYWHVGEAFSSPLIYLSERWAETGADLLCGITQRAVTDGGACIVLPGSFDAAEWVGGKDVTQWLRVGQGVPLNHQGCYYAIGSARVVIFPENREGLEWAIEDALPFVGQSDFVHSGAIFAFEGWRELRPRLLSMHDDDVGAIADTLYERRLFSVRVGLGYWGITPGSLTRERILDIQTPVLHEISFKANS